MRKIVKTVSVIISFILLFQLLVIPEFASNRLYAQSQTDNIKVNFEPNTSPVPSGYIGDFGEVYGPHNGYYYGWNYNHQDLTNEANTNSDLRLDTTLQLNTDSVWEVELMNGNYDVTVSVGDAVYGTTNSIQVEGINFWNGLSLAPNLFIQDTRTIKVQDGKLTLSQGSGNKTKVNYIEITKSIDSIPPTAPQNLTAKNISDNSLTILWDPSTDNNGVAGYYIYRDDQKIATVTSSVYQDTVTGSVYQKFDDFNLSPSTTYQYEVAAFDKANNISLKTIPLFITTATFPGNGIGLKGEYFNGTDLQNLSFSRIDSLINFDWGGQAPSLTMSKDNFSIRWSGKVEPRFTEEYMFYSETHGGVRLWVDNQLIIDQWNKDSLLEENGKIKLNAGQAYDIKMEYQDTSGAAIAKLFWSSKSQEKQLIPTIQLNPPFIPEPPKNINISSTSTSISLTWDMVDNVTGYDIEADGVVIDNGNNLTYTNANLLPFTSHSYRIRAKIPELASKWSSPINTLTKIAIPDQLSVEEINNQLNITWNVVANATGYELEVDGSVVYVGANLTYTHTNLMPNTEHTYRVRAVNGSMVSDWSPMISKVFAATVPTNLISKQTSSSIELFWDDVIGAVGYEIEADGKIIANGLSNTFIHENLPPNTQHKYRVRALLNGGNGDWSIPVITSTLRQPGNGFGLTGEYYDSADLTSYITTQLDGTIDFNWKKKSPVKGIVDKDYSVRWTGQIEPKLSEKYTFSTETHGGIRVWIDNQLLIDDWATHNHSVTNGTIDLIAGKRYDIKIEYRETNGVGLARLYWESKSQALEIVPMSQLYPIGILENLATNSTETTIGLTWSPVAFAKGYDIEIDGMMTHLDAATSYLDKDLEPGTQHTFRVRAINSIVHGEWSPTMTAYTRLGKPTITGIDPTETTLTVNWGKVAGATSYDIEVDGVITNNDNHTSYIHENLLSGTEHSYRIRAKTAAVIGEWTSIASKWTLPGIPKSITTLLTSNSITLHWDLVRGATDYELDTYNTVTNIGNTTTFVDDGLNPNTQRTYRIRAKNSSGVGKWTSIIARKTLPAIPTNIQTTATDTKISVSWDPSAGATSYDLEVDGQILSDIIDTQYIHYDLQPNTLHTYRIRAKNEDGVSNWSNLTKTMTLPSTPKNITAIAETNQITLHWDKVEGVTGYQVEVDGLIIDNGNSTTFVHKELYPNTEHTYRVRARNGQIASFWTESITKMTLPEVPKNLLAAADVHTITLNWEMVVGATGYDIEVDGLMISNGLNTSFNHDGLDPNTEHTYRVRAKNEGGPGEWSDPITIKTIFDIPTSIVEKSASTSITLTWDSVLGATSYDIYFDGKLMNVEGKNEFTQENLEPFTWHVLRVRAKDGTNIGKWSEPIKAVTLLGIPTNVKLISKGKNITITWDAVSGADDYVIEVDGVLIDLGSTTKYIDNDLPPNTIHTYRIMVKNEIVDGEWSISYTQLSAPAIPKNLKAEATTNSITITWNLVDGATSYDILVDGNLMENLLRPTYTLKGLGPNTFHTFKVRSVNEGGNSEWTDELDQNTNPEIEIAVPKDIIFNFVVVVPTKKGVTTRTVTVTYNPDEVEVLDLVSNTPESNQTAGYIKGTNITVTSFIPGKIVYSISNANRAVVIGIKFMSKTNNHSKIIYTVE